jgi:hypothetical protein
MVGTKPILLPARFHCWARDCMAARVAMTFTFKKFKRAKVSFAAAKVNAWTRFGTHTGAA